jgi:glycosyltransferase involved in cell wall biosynthesis
MLSILVISRSEERLFKLFQSICQNRIAEDLEVLVSWNGKGEPPSFEGRLNDLRIYYYIQRPYNFAKNNNSLARYASGDKILFLNDDMILDENCLARAVAEINKPEIGIVGANLRYENNKVQHAGVRFRDGNLPYHEFKHELDYRDPRVIGDKFVPAVTGAFILMRRTEFLSIKFDEQFEVAGEDVALCLEYRHRFKRGVLYCGASTALHYENMTRRETNERDTPEGDRELIKKYASREIAGVPLTQVRHPRVRIVTEKEGWIMHRKAREIQVGMGDDYVRINQDWPEAEIHYYINYGYVNKKPAKGLFLANFTHFDPDSLAEKFVEVAHSVDHCTSVSKLTTQKLLELGVPSDKITTIIVGADDRFTPKLLLGISGRPYKGGRKGEDLIQAILADEELMSKCQLVALNPDWKLPTLQCSDMADYYRALDYLLITAKIEGGPVPVMEALACGTLAIAPAIGVVPEFPHVPYEVGSFPSLKATINALYEDLKLAKGQIARTMFGMNWSGWSARHEKLFRRLLLSAPLS